MLRAFQCVPSPTPILLSPQLSHTIFTRSVKQMSAAQKFNLKLKEARERILRGEEKQSIKLSTIPCIDATQLVREPSKKPQMKQKIYRKRLRFVKNGMSVLQAFYAPSERSPLYSIVQQTRNLMERSRIEREKRESMQREYDKLIGKRVDEKDEDVAAGVRQYVDGAAGSVMSKKEAKAAAKSKKKA